jgi:hypothetical protein
MQSPKQILYVHGHVVMLLLKITAQVGVITTKADLQNMRYIPRNHIVNEQINVV